MRQRTTLFISHGGGPMPLLGDKGHVEMIQKLKQIRTMIEKPSAILLISAHWEESVATVTTAKAPSLLYDYHGFPEEAYNISYPAKGEPQLAEAVQNALSSAGIPVQSDENRGFDHGMFVPLTILYPEAEIPVVQLSLVNSLDPKLHIEIGKALAKLPYKNLLIIGSGFTFHNLRSFFSRQTAEKNKNNRSFENWIESTLTNKDLSEAERENQLVRWEEASGARFCHPREEHLIPLHLCYGVEQKPATDYFRVNILNTESSFFLWR
jgi:4,5-DOPA dioxygenase extradiol